MKEGLIVRLKPCVREKHRCPVGIEYHATATVVGTLQDVEEGAPRTRVVLNRPLHGLRFWNVLDVDVIGKDGK